MHIYRNSYRLLAFSLALLTHIQAEMTDTPPQLDLDFQVYIWPHGGPAPDNSQDMQVGNESILLPKYVSKQIGLLQGEHITLIAADKARLSALAQYSGPTPIRFVEPTAIPSEDQRPDIIAEVHPPNSMKNGLFIFFPIANDTVKYQILAVDTTHEKISAGHSIIYNLTPDDIAIKIGNEQMQMNTMANETVTINHLRDSSLPIQIAVESEQSGQWMLRYSTRKIIQPDSRLIFIIYNPEGKRSLYRILALNAD